MAAMSELLPFSLCARLGVVRVGCFWSWCCRGGVGHRFCEWPCLFVVLSLLDLDCAAICADRVQGGGRV